jgi:uncharacterized membrane protein YkvA (DUF1232 family)
LELRNRCFNLPAEISMAKEQSRMKKRKTVTRKAPAQTIEKRQRYEKAAVRSPAFARAIVTAASHSRDPEALRSLFEEASQKVATIPKEPFKDSWPYLQAMLRLIRAYSRGEYRDVSQDTLVRIIAAVSYLVDPFDLIPDEIPFLGFLDDATVVSFALARTRQALDDFMIWETTAL